MLWIPIKKSDPVNLSRSLEVFILKNYDKPTHERLRPFFTSLDDARRAFVESSESSNLEPVIQSLETYLSGLTLLESRIPISSTDLKFNWSDSYLKSKQPVLTFTLEKLCVMYNIAASWSKMGSETDLRSLNGHKIALSAFQNSLNWLSLCKRLINENPVDQKGEITSDNFELWASVMTAQGYCTLYDKLDKQTAKKESISKLAFSVYSNYEKAVSFLSSVKSFSKEQENILKFNSAFFEAAGHYFQALSEKEKAANIGNGFGLVVARLKVSEKCLNRALSLRGIRGNLLENGKQLLATVASEKSTAENENFTIYMERIPEENEINVLEPLNMIIPKDVVFREFPGKELILVIVPAEIIGIHKEFEAFIMKQFEVSKEKVEVCLDEVKKSFFGKTFEGIPEVTWLQISDLRTRDCESEIQQIKKIKSDSQEKLNQALQELKKEELEDEELRKRFGPAWTRPSSSSANQEFKKELELLLNKLAQASDTDEKTVSEYHANKASLDILSLARSDLDKLVPAVDSSVLSEKERLSLELQESEASLLNTLNEYREAIFKTNSSEDLKRIIDQKLVKEEVFEEISLEFSDYRDRISQEIEILKQKQEKLLQLLASVSVEYRAAEFLDNVGRSLETKKNLATRLEQGLKFYGSFESRADLICTAVKDFVFKRDEEKKNIVARMHHSTAGPVNPVSNPSINYTPANRPPSNIVYQPAGSPSSNIPYQPQGYPPQSSNSAGIPAQSYPPQGYPAPQGYPPQGYGPQGYPPHGYPAQGYPPQGFSPQPYPQGYPQGSHAQGYPPQGYAPQGYAPPQGYPPQGYPGPGYSTQPYPGQGPPQGYPGNYSTNSYPPNPFQQEYRLLLDWVSSINLPSCIEVSNFEALQRGVALNDISCLILNTSLPENIYRSETLSEYKQKHNFRTLLKSLEPVLPFHLSLIKAEDLLTSPEKLFVLLRWMVKVLDFPFYQKLKSSFPRFYSRGVEITENDLQNMRNAKSKSLGKMLEKTDERLKKPESSKFKSPWTTKGIDLLRILKDLHVFCGKSQEEFLALCKTGELIADFINALEGKQERLRGIIRKPLWKSYKAANVSKILKFLRSFPKMKSRFLWSDKEILEGHIKTIKGLMFDVLVLYNKVPKKDSRAEVKKTEFTSPDMKVNSPLLTVTRKSLPKKHFTTGSLDTKITSPREYSEFLDERSPELTQNLFLGDDVQRTVIEWLTNLGLGHYIVGCSKDLLDDNLRNGVVLCELASMVANKKNLLKHKAPKSLYEACENIENAFKILRIASKEIPLDLLSNPLPIARGDSDKIWTILNHLMLSHPRLLDKTSKTTLSDLPYNPSEIKALEESLLEFILSQGVIDRRRLPKSFQELLPELVSGVLLCDIVSRVIQKPIFGVFRSQVSESLAFSNIKKALQPLRSLRKFGQKYVFCEQEIFQGNLGVILGLLEDLHRFSDKLPPRQRGQDYHSDGPYFGRPKLKHSASRRLSFSLFSEFENSRPASPGSRFLIQSQSTSVFKGRSQPVSPVLDPNDKLKGFTWLKFIGIFIPDSLDMRLESITEFRNGEILAEIIGKLEWKKVEGICPNAVVQASCFHNLSKVFDILRQKPGFPSFLFFCEEEVFNGDGNVVRALLAEIYRIYKRTIISMKTFNSKKVALD